MSEQRTILIVTDDARRTQTWTDVLARAGYLTFTCPGPTMTPCPRLGAERCALREAVDAAVVEVQSPGEPFPHGEWMARACTRLPDDHTTVYIADEGGPGSIRHPVAPSTLVEAVHEAVAGRARRPV